MGPTGAARQESRPSSGGMVRNLAKPLKFRRARDNKIERIGSTFSLAELLQLRTPSPVDSENKK